jgi:hypothetical protein
MWNGEITETNNTYFFRRTQVSTDKLYYQDVGEWADVNMVYGDKTSDLFKKSGCFITSICNVLRTDNFMLPGEKECNPLNLLTFINENKLINSNSELLTLDFFRKIDIEYIRIDFEISEDFIQLVQDNLHAYYIIVQIRTDTSPSHFMMIDSLVKGEGYNNVMLWDTLNQNQDKSVVIRSIRLIKKNTANMKAGTNNREVIETPITKQKINNFWPKF